MPDIEFAVVDGESKSGEVRLPDDRSYERCYQVRYESCNYRSKRCAHDDGDGEIEYITAENKLFESLHGVSLSPRQGGIE